MDHNNQVLLDFGKGLLDIREVFHKTGRLDDSNAKLEEIVKLISLELAQTRFPKANITPLETLLNKSKVDKNYPLIKNLNISLLKATQLPAFLNEDGNSFFGSTPSFVLTETDKELTQKLIEIVLKTINGTFKNHSKASEKFEMLNEAFGHFVRDNFRNNIEDAQYMTPPEVVNYMCRVAISELKGKSNLGKEIIVADPSCGVGSFLANFYRLFIHENSLKNKDVNLIGQDKVDRMARLTKLNLLLFNISKSSISRGNSLVGMSKLQEYNGLCDVILTNPPFGARFQGKDLEGIRKEDYPLLFDSIKDSNSVFDSEILFLDRYVSLLKPGGFALIVLPDGVVSATGQSRMLREKLSNQCTLRSITELPAVTFGQAGTRTKTCVLYFEKNKPSGDEQVFISVANEIGFDVVSRKGVPVKKESGENELIKITTLHIAHDSMNSFNKPHVYSESPSCVSVPIKQLNIDSWTPNFHSASRYLALTKLKKISSSEEIELKPLKELVEFLKRRHGRNDLEAKCISVLHVGDFGFLNVQEIMEYNPKYPGVVCQPGEVLFSKINPRIPRVLVVPDLKTKLTCSSEFEVMKTNGLLSAQAIMLLLLTPFVQTQIQALTSGTSSSHNRIKSEQLANVTLPIPNKGTKAWREFQSVCNEFTEATGYLNTSAVKLNNCMVALNKLYSI